MYFSRRNDTAPPPPFPLRMKTLHWSKNFIGQSGRWRALLKRCVGGVGAVFRRPHSTKCHEGLLHGRRESHDWPELICRSTPMKTRAAVAFEAKKPLEIVELDLE